VKEKTNRKNINNSKKISPASNLVLNSIILLLGVVIIFLTYSLITHISEIYAGAKKINDKDAASPVIQVEVLNGCGASGVAEKFTDFLRKEKFDVVQVGNYMSFDIDNTLVIDRTGNTANAEKVAAALGIDNKNVIMQKNENYFLDVSVVIGKDYKKIIK
jgi:LytR cell envelope-related transcriptional attenuator